MKEKITFLKKGDSNSFFFWEKKIQRGFTKKQYWKDYITVKKKGGVGGGGDSKPFSFWVKERIQRGFKKTIKKRLYYCKKKKGGGVLILPFLRKRNNSKRFKKKILKSCSSSKDNISKEQQSIFIWKLCFVFA